MCDLLKGHCRGTSTNRWKQSSEGNAIRPTWYVRVPALPPWVSEFLPQSKTPFAQWWCNFNGRISSRYLERKIHRKAEVQTGGNHYKSMHFVGESQWRGCFLSAALLVMATLASSSLVTHQRGQEAVVVAGGGKNARAPRSLATGPRWLTRRYYSLLLGVLLSRRNRTISLLFAPATYRFIVLIRRCKLGPEASVV